MSTHISDFYRGDTVSWSLTFTENGSPLDLTGAVITFTMKSKKDDPDSDAVIQKVATLNADPTTGLATIVIPATETYPLLGQYHYDFQLVQSDGTVLTLAIGTVEVKYDITRSVS